MRCLSRILSSYPTLSLWCSLLAWGVQGDSSPQEEGPHWLPSLCLFSCPAVYVRGGPAYVNILFLYKYMSKVKREDYRRTIEGPSRKEESDG